jgi:peptidoglycan-associated lipoprotein
MIRLLLLLVAAFLWTHCQTAKQTQPGLLFTPATSPVVEEEKQTPTPPPSTTFVLWDKKLIDLGTVKRGEKRSMFFEFTNTSPEGVQIDLVDACECTKVDYPRRVIEPGQKGRLDVVFDSTEKEKSETVRITVVFKNTHPNGLPRIEVVEYAFELVP